MTENVIAMLVKIISDSNHLNISINKEEIRSKDVFLVRNETCKKEQSLN